MIRDTPRYPALSPSPRTFPSWLQPVFIVWPLVLGLLHFRLVRSGTFDITMPVAFCTAGLPLLLAGATYRLNHLMIAVGILVYTLALGLSAHEFGEFVRSLLLLGNLLLMILAATGVPLPDDLTARRFVKVFLGVSLVLSILIIAQAITLNFLDSRALMNPFGPFSSPGPGGEVYEPSPLALAKRANGPFSEPSAAGWFMALAAALALSAEKLAPVLARVTASASLLAAAATMSLSGLLNATAVAFAYMVVIRKRGGTVWAVLLTVVVLGTVGLSLVRFGIASRFDHLWLEGTSVYYRLGAPIRLLSESLMDHPFGHPLGQTEYILSKNYMINWIYGSSTNIDNTFFLISFYYGIPGALACLGLLFRAAWTSVSRSRAAPVFVALALGLGETGGGWSHGWAALIGFSIIVVRLVHSGRHEARAL